MEYKKQGFKIFEMMMAQITGDVVRKLFAVQISEGQGDIESGFEGEEIQEAPVRNAVDTLDPTGGRPQGGMSRLPTAQEALSGKPAGSMSGGGIASGPVGMRPLPPGVDVSRLGRNDVCPCGSGKKYKKCHGA